MKAAPFACALLFVSPAQLWAPDVVSTAQSEVRITFSPDGKRMLWGAIGWSSGPGTTGGGWDIYESERVGGGWSKPRLVSFNSTANDFDPSFAPDGSGVYLFVARRAGERREHIENLEALNTPDEDFDATFLHDGVSVVYTSGKLETDDVALYVAEFRDGRFQPRQRLPAAVNSQKPGAWTLGPSISQHDPGALYFTSEHAEGRGRTDIYRIDYRMEAARR